MILLSSPGVSPRGGVAGWVASTSGCGLTWWLPRVPSWNPPAAGEAIAAFEAAHGIGLPAAHREFLLRANGGGVGYARLFGVGRPDFLDLDRQVAEMRPCIEGMADGPVLPFASDWGGSYFCYDLRRQAEVGAVPGALLESRVFRGTRRPADALVGIRPRFHHLLTEGHLRFIPRQVARAPSKPGHSRRVVVQDAEADDAGGQGGEGVPDRPRAGRTAPASAAAP